MRTWGFLPNPAMWLDPWPRVPMIAMVTRSLAPRTRPGKKGPSVPAAVATAPPWRARLRESFPLMTLTRQRVPNVPGTKGVPSRARGVSSAKMVLLAVVAGCSSGGGPPTPGDAAPARNASLPGPDAAAGPPDVSAGAPGPDVAAGAPSPDVAVAAEARPPEAPPVGPA